MLGMLSSTSVGPPGGYFLALLAVLTRQYFALTYVLCATCLNSFDHTGIRLHHAISVYTQVSIRVAGLGSFCTAECNSSVSICPVLAQFMFHIYSTSVVCALIFE